MNVKHDRSARKDFLLITGSVVVGFLVSFCGHHYFSKVIDISSSMLSDLTDYLIEIVKRQSEIEIKSINFKPIYHGFIYCIPSIVALSSALRKIGAKWNAYTLSFEDKFRNIGIYGKKKVDRLDEDGSVESVNIAPRLLREKFIDEDTIVRLFTTASVGLGAWKTKLDDIDQEFNWNVYKLNLTRTKRAVIITTVSETKKLELKKQFKKQLMYDDKFDKIGLYAQGTRTIEEFGRIHKGKNYPVYLGEEPGVNPKVRVLSFKLEGSSRSMWKEKQFEIENVLDSHVYRIKLSEKSKQIFELWLVDEPIKTMYEIDESMYSLEDGTINLGIGLLGMVSVNINDHPHGLLAGVTNSGKSVFFEFVIYQYILQGAYIIPLDFKGGVHMKKFEDFGSVITTYKEAAVVLKEVIEEHHARMKLFYEMGLENRLQYNKLVADEDKLARIVVCVDELAEVTDRTGKSKAKKSKGSEEDETDTPSLELLDEIESYLNSIARVGRASGVHLITATQRPDANVIKGQIKNNIALRASGRMTDPQPSKMVLGSTAAVALEDIQGRFIVTTGSDLENIQVPYFKKVHIKSGYYRKGCLLVIEDEVDAPYEIVEEDEEVTEFSDIEEDDTTDDMDEEICENVIDLSEWDKEEDEETVVDSSSKESLENPPKGKFDFKL